MDMPGFKTGYTSAETRRAESYRPPERSVPRANDLAGMRWPQHAFMVFSYDQLSTIFLLGAQLHRTEQNPLRVALQFTANDRGYANLEVLRPEVPQPAGTSRVYLVRTEEGNALYDFNGPAGATAAQDLQKNRNIELPFTGEAHRKIVSASTFVSTQRPQTQAPHKVHLNSGKKRPKKFTPKSVPHRRWRNAWTFEDWKQVNLRQFHIWYEEAYPNLAQRPETGDFLIRWQEKENGRYHGIRAFAAGKAGVAPHQAAFHARKTGPDTFELLDTEKASAAEIAQTWHQRAILGLTLSEKAQSARPRAVRTLERKFEVPSKASLDARWREAYGSQTNPHVEQKYILQFHSRKTDKGREYYSVKALKIDSPEISSDPNVGKIPMSHHPDGSFEIGKPYGMAAAELAQKWGNTKLPCLRVSRAAQTARPRTAALSKAEMLDTSREKLEARWKEAYGSAADPNQAQDFVVQFRRTNKGTYEAARALQADSAEIKTKIPQYGKLYFTHNPDGTAHLSKAKDLGAADFATAWRDKPVEGLTVAEDAVYAWRHPKVAPKGFTTVETLTGVVLAPITLPAIISWKTFKIAVTHPFFRGSASFVAADTAAKLITGHANEIDFKHSAKLMAIDSAIRIPSRAILADLLPASGAARSFMLSNFPTVLTMAVIDYSATGTIHPTAYAENLPLMGMGNLFGKAVSTWLGESFALAKFAGSFASFTAFFVLADFKQRYEQAEDLAISTSQLANTLKSSTPEQNKLQYYIQQRLFSSPEGSAMSALLEKIAHATEKPDTELEYAIGSQVQRLIHRSSTLGFAWLSKVAEQKNKVAELRQIYLTAATQRAIELQKEIDELLKNVDDEVEGELYRPMMRMELENALDQFKHACISRYADKFDARAATLAIGFTQQQRRQVIAAQLKSYEDTLTLERQDRLRTTRYDCEHEHLHPLCQMQNSGKFLREDVAGVEALDWSQQSYTLQESPPEDLSILAEMSLADALLFLKYRGVELFSTVPQK